MSTIMSVNTLMQLVNETGATYVVATSESLTMVVKGNLCFPFPEFTNGEPREYWLRIQDNLDQLGYMYPAMIKRSYPNLMTTILHVL